MTPLALPKHHPENVGPSARHGALSLSLSAPAEDPSPGCLPLQ